MQFHRAISIVSMILLAFLPPLAYSLTVDAGLANFQVFQCDANGVARLELSGTGAAGTAQARVAAGETEVIPWTNLGAVAEGKWSGAIDGVPVGGPYQVSVRIIDEAGAETEKILFDQVLVGDVWILAGQSNMQGVGNRLDNETPDPRVNLFAMNHEWRLAEDPLHILPESPDSVHADPSWTPEEKAAKVQATRDGNKGVGLGLSFAKEMLRRTNRPVGLIASAHGGTSMAQWDPALRDQGGESLYGSMYKQVMAAAGGKVRGVLWYQGESDANPEAAAVFREKFKALVAAFRTDFNAPELPFYYVQIGRFVHPDPVPDPWNKIQSEQAAAETEIPHSGMVAAIDLALDDLIHVGTPGLKILGYRLANLAEADLYGGAISRGPRFEKMERVDTPFGNTLRVTFSGVNGGLSAQGRASGFALTPGAEGAEVPALLKQEIAADDPNTVVLWVAKWPENPHLWYGWGLNPYCNIVDQANMAVPVFGPLPVPVPEAAPQQ